MRRIEHDHFSWIMNTALSIIVVPCFTLRRWYVYSNSFFHMLVAYRILILLFSGFFVLFLIH